MSAQTMDWVYRTRVVELQNGSASLPDMPGWKIAWADIPQTDRAFVVYRRPRKARANLMRSAKLHET